MLEFVFVLVFVGVTFIDRYLFFMHYHLREGFREESISGCSFRNVKSSVVVIDAGVFSTDIKQSGNIIR